MLGIVYTEFMDMVSAQFSDEILDEMLDVPGLTTQGAFTAVGYYDHADMIKMLARLSDITGESVDALVEHFGEHLFAALVAKYPAMLEGKGSSLQMLESVDSTIHVEVRKLYPEAELPEFTCVRGGPNFLHMEYRSQRPFSYLALGLIKGCASHFKDELKISHESFDREGQFETHFAIQQIV